MLPFRVIVKPQHRLVPSATPPCPSPFSLTLTQPLSFQTFTHSSAQRATSIYFSFNHFRTLSLATEGVPPFFPFWNSSPSLSLPHYAPYFQALPWGPFCKPFLFIFIHVMGSVPSPRHSNAQTRGRFDVFPSDLLSFHILAHSCAHTKNSSLLFSTASALFAKNTRGGGT